MTPAVNESDWLECPNAVLLLIAQLKEASTTQGDPTPSIGRVARIGGRLMSRRFVDQAFLPFHRALLKGELPASFVDDTESVLIPKSAFIDRKVVTQGLSTGLMELDPLWPDDWQKWNNSPWFVPRKTFIAWLESDSPLICNDENLTLSSFGDSPQQITDRLPSKELRVPISEALSFLAFGIALSAERLDRAIRRGSFCGGNLEISERKLEHALSTLCEAGSDGEVDFFGRYAEGDSGKVALPNTIPPVQLDDHRQYSLGYDRLFYGQGLFPHHVSGSRDAYFTDVKVPRHALLHDFPRGKAVQKYSSEERQDWMRAHANLNVDAAHKLYTKEARFDGTKQADWRREWREIIKRSPGRPRKPRSP